MALAREQQHLADSEADMPRFRSCATASSILFAFVDHFWTEMALFSGLAGE